jgi:hypothetical protein
MTEELVTIKLSAYRDMQRRLEKLAALEDGGVDNWEWYDAAMVVYHEAIEDLEDE